MASGIYKIVNKVNNKIYVGSAVSFTDRRNLHFSQLRRNIHHSIALQRAYNKYGVDSFEFIVLEECSIEDLITREQTYLDELKPSYNTCKIAGSTLGAISTRRRKVIQYSLNGIELRIWDCLQDVMDELHLTNSSKISQVCKRTRNKAYGYVWRYVEDAEFSITTVRRGKSISEVDTEGNVLRTWSRVKDCAQDIGTTSIVLCKILSSTDRQKTFEGRLFTRVTI